MWGISMQCQPGENSTIMELSPGAEAEEKGSQRSGKKAEPKGQGA